MNEQKRLIEESSEQKKRNYKSIDSAVTTAEK